MFKKTAIIAVLLIGCLICASSAEEKKLASAYINIGIDNYNSGNYLEAILNLRSAQQLSPSPVSVYKYLGLSYSKLYLWQQAAQEFDKILMIDPGDAERQVIIANIHEWEKQSEYIPAMAKYSFYSIKYKNKIWEDPQNLLNYLSLTEIYKCSGRYEEAESFFRALIKDRPDSLDFKKYLAEVYFLDKKYSEAGGLYKKILEIEPLNTDANLGMDLILKKRYEDILAKRPENITTYLKLARVLNDMKRYEDAIAAYDKYLQADNANIEANREMEETKKVLSALTK